MYIYLSYHGTANRSDRDTVKREVNPVGTDLDETGLVRGEERERERGGRVELVDTFAPRLPPL